MAAHHAGLTAWHSSAEAGTLLRRAGGPELLEDEVGEGDIVALYDPVRRVQSACLRQKRIPADWRALLMAANDKDTYPLPVVTVKLHAAGGLSEKWPWA
jgi:hypothetical protein